MLAALVAILVPALAWVGRILIVSLIARALVGFGVAFVGYHFVVGPILDAIKAQMSGWPSDLAQWVGLLDFDKAVTIICSAYVIRFSTSALRAVKTGS